MKQKVQDAKKARFAGFFSPVKLMRKINDARINNYTTTNTFFGERTTKSNTSKLTTFDIVPFVPLKKFNSDIATPNFE